MIEMEKLPFEMNALEPYISERTLSFHYGKHYATYVKNTNDLIAGTDLENAALEDIVSAAAGEASLKGLFNNAAQAWNHAFFWKCMKNGGGKPQGEILARIEKYFGSYEKFHEEFKNAAVTQFGSGWAWLVEKDGKLEIMKTSNADTPIAHGLTPLLTIDVWEHAYYLDYQNRSADFVEAFLNNLANYQN